MEFLFHKLQRRAFMNRNVIRFVAFYLVLRIIIGGMVSVSLVTKILCVDLDYFS